MTWAARIEQIVGGLALTFPKPLARLDRSNDVAQHLASLLGIEARQQVAGVVRMLGAEGSRRALCCDCDDCPNGGHSG
jgi:hypothetical protein